VVAPWVECPDCGDFWCRLHGMHAYDCACPPVDDWAEYDLSPYLPSVLRYITPVEAERLQSFPDGWTDGQSDSARYKQIGNAVTVNVIEWIARRIQEVSR
jgi:site-specific DNA-cytosine methylase